MHLSAPATGNNDMLYFLHVVAEHTFNVIGGDAAETIISEDEVAEKQAVCGPLHAAYTARLFRAFRAHAA